MYDLFGPFFSPYVCLSFTKLRFLQSFWGIEHVKTLIGSKAMVSDVTLVPVQVRHIPKKWQLINCHFYTIFGHSFANYMVIFLKTEIQIVILRCLTSLNLNWYKSYDTKCKNAKNTNVWFCTKSQKNGNGNICVLCHNFWTNQNLEQLSTSKWPSEPQFCERWTYIRQKNGQKWL